MVAATEPQCQTNLSLADHSVNAFDSILVDCYVRYTGRLSHVITCEPGEPGIINITNSRVTYKQVIPASLPMHGQTILCTTVFASNDSYTWISPPIHVVSHIGPSVGKCTVFDV